MEALLIDLDGTLLRSNMEEFLPAYMQRLSQALADFADPEVLVTQLMAATQAMIGNLDPTRTLKETFDRRFYPAIDQDPAEMLPDIDRFYGQEYGKLRVLTDPMPGSEALVEFAQTFGLDQVIATNPLFPLTAIEQRIEWAGFPVESMPFRFATAFETFHFAKPRPEYYAEILGLLGVPPHEAAFIGDDPVNDLEPASALGLAVYHFSQHPEPEFAGGDFLGAIRWLEAQMSAEMEQEIGNKPEALLAQARGYLAALLTLCERGESLPFDQRPSAREWAPVEILCHLRDTEREVHQPRFKRLLAEPSPFLSAVDSDQWADERRYRDQDPRAALEDFVDARQETIAQFVNMGEEDWGRPARHSIFGPTTLAEMVGVAVGHDLLHLNQLRQTFETLDESTG